ncbi:MAG: glycoside hydrolase family 3 C-terminal domain-containing protein, partial [Solobacterium sp.]|nr:glycoside hydrolase family 3 C-terminal domain-containing protein [Solobacterium sp.]
MHDYEKTHSDTIRSLGGECTVLLRSNGAFPLPEPCEIALYGSGARRTVKGGTGSGEVNSRYMVSAEEGLKNAGFTILTKDWLDTYDTIRTNAKQEFICGLHKQASEHHTLAVFESMGAVMPEPEYEIPFCAENCPAVYVLSRICGEGSDRRPVPGDILLTETEIRDINALDQKHSPFMLVLNTGGPVDLSPVKDVSNILILSQLGAETGNILADLILGRSVPSGKLTTTWSVWEDYARIGTFGERDDTLYQEGIYVGYRYFDSVGKKALFPFGHGLGYTAFGLNCVSVKEAAGTITLRASVRNTGKYIGKETAQLYVSLPQGRLDQPYQVLAAFAKSKELLPQEEEELTLTFDLRDLASYDKTKASWILEAGDYILRLGNSSTETTPAAVLRISREIIVRTCRNCFTEPWFTDWKPQERTEEHISGVPILNISTDTFITRKTDYALREETEPLIETLSDAELAYLNIGAFDPNLGPLSIIGNASKSVAG